MAIGSEAQLWSGLTPGGELNTTISNPDAARQFELGKSYYLDLTTAE